VNIGEGAGVSEIGDLVRGHYARSGLERAILAALEEAGFDTSAPAAEDLFPIDQLHAGAPNPPAICWSSLS
jgi:hypothetical protein